MILVRKAITTNADLFGAMLSEETNDDAHRVAADDRVVDENDALAVHVLRQHAELFRDAALAQLRVRLDERPTHVAVSMQYFHVRNAALNTIRLCIALESFLC